MKTSSERILHERGLRHTRVSSGLLRFFLAHGDEFFSHEEIRLHLQERGLEMDRTTLYRMLERFEDVQLVGHIVDEQRVTRYGALRLPGMQSGNRFVCTSCHRQTHLPQSTDEQAGLLAQVQEQCAKSGKQSLQVQLAIFGTCEHCVEPSPKHQDAP